MDERTKLALKVLDNLEDGPFLDGLLYTMNGNTAEMNRQNERRILRDGLKSGERQPGKVLPGRGATA